MQEALAALSREVRLLAAGGTIAMRGERAVPVLNASELIDQLPALARVPALRAETVFGLPSAQVTLDQALELAQRACATYGFEGTERDLRCSGGICVPFLSPAAARVALLCCLGAGRDRAGIAEALASWDAAIDSPRS